MAVNASDKWTNFRFSILDFGLPCPVLSIQNPKSKIQNACNLLDRKGQATIEHAVLTAVLVAALLGMAIVTKRAVMGRWRTVGDSFGSGRQYEPGVTRVN